MLKQAIQTAVAAVAAASHVYAHAVMNVAQYAVRNATYADAAAISHAQAIHAQITTSAQTTMAAQM